MKHIRTLLLAFGAALTIGACSSATGPSDANLNTWDPGRETMRDGNGLPCSPDLSQC